MNRLFWLLCSPLLKKLSRSHPVLGRSWAFATGPFVTRARTLAQGVDSQPGGHRGQRTAARGKLGGQRVKAEAGAEQGPVWAGQRCPERSGDFLKARLGTGPGCPLLGVACPWGAGWGGVRYSLPDRSGALAAEPGVRCPPRAGAGTLGDLAGGPGGGDSCCR